MPSQKTNSVLRYIQTVAVADAAAGLTDRELLDRFAGRRDEAAFAALVRRHGPTVLRVCQQILGSAHDAEDGFQATFLVLGRQAGRLRPRESVGGWLHQVAYRTAHKARIAAARRAKHEGRTPSRAVPDPLTQITVRESQALLDRELGRLPDKFRAPLVLCYLEGLTRDEAARRLGWPANTLKSRLEQARDRLRVRLIARGLSLSAVLTAALVGDGSVQATVPTALLAKTIAATTSGAAGVSANVASLTEGIVNAMTHRPIRILAALLIGLGLAGTTTGVLAYRAAAEPPATPQLGAPQPDARKPETGNQPEKTLRVVVLDAQGKPLAGAKIHSGIWTEEKGFKSNHDYETDAAGIAQVELPKSYYILRLWAKKKTFVGMFAHWEQNELSSGVVIPSEYTFRLETGVTAGGRIVDEQGKPIAGAKVAVRGNSLKPAGADGRSSYDTWLADGRDAAVTDMDGRWQIDNVPGDPNMELSFVVSHPDYVSDEHGENAQKAAGITTALLRQQTGSVTLKRGVIITGRVTDPAGKAVKDALVVPRADCVHGE